MEVIVTKDEVKVSEKEQVHKGEYNATEINFTFSSEYDGLIKKAIFENKENKLELTIADNKCIVPAEIAEGKENKFNLRVYGYQQSGDNLIIRYSPSYTQVPIYRGSYMEGTTPVPVIEDSVDVTYSSAGIYTLTPDEGYDAMRSANIEVDISTDYDDLSNKPSINSVTLSGNKTSSDLSLQSEIDSSNKLSSDLVDDTNKTNKFVTATDKTNWNGKYSKPGTGIPSTDLASAVQTSLGKADTAIQPSETSGLIKNDGTIDTTQYTTNTGTITSVKMNGSTISSSGEADLGTVITDISNKQDTIQYSTMEAASSTLEGTIVQFIGTTGTYTNGYYYKCVEDSENPGTYIWTQINVQPGGDVSGKEDVSNKVTSISSSSTDTQYPSAKCVYDSIVPQVFSRYQTTYSNPLVLDGQKKGVYFIEDSEGYLYYKAKSSSTTSSISSTSTDYIVFYEDIKIDTMTKNKNIGFIKRRSSGQTQIGYLYLNNSNQLSITNTKTIGYVISYGAQTFNGVKTFADIPKIYNSQLATTDDQITCKKYVDNAVAPSVTTSSTSTYTISSLSGNKVYKLGEITSLTISAVTTFDRESVIYFESGSTATDITIPTSLDNIGDVPTLTTSGDTDTGTCATNKKYIISVLNNIAVWKEY